MSDLLTPTYDLISRPVLNCAKCATWRPTWLICKPVIRSLKLRMSVCARKVGELRRNRVLLDRYRELLALPVEPSLHVISARVIADLQSPFVRTWWRIPDISPVLRRAKRSPAAAVLSGVLFRLGGFPAVCCYSRILTATCLCGLHPTTRVPFCPAIMPTIRYCGFCPKIRSLRRVPKWSRPVMAGRCPLAFGGVVRVDDDGRPFVDLQEDLHNLSYVRIISTRDIEQPPRETNARTLPGAGR